MTAIASWAQASDVSNYTGVTVTDAQVMQAQVSIEILCGRTFAVPQVTMRVRDLYYLKLAVAFQAAWMSQQPDLFSRSDLSSISQDGMSLVYDPATAGKAVVCAPMARRAMKRLTWTQGRSLHTNPVNAAPAFLVPGDAIVDYSGEPWTEISSGTS